ncbi:MAG: ATP-binding protein [Candidatus Uhrbacteria bacterium]
MKENSGFLNKLFKKKTNQELVALELRCQKLAARSQVAEEKFKNIFDLSLDGILLIDLKKNKFSQANQTFCRQLGYNLAEFKKLTLEKFYPAKSFQRLINELKNSTKMTASLVYGQPIKRKNRSVFFADIHSSIVTIAGKDFLMSVFHDITQRRKIEQQLLADRVKDDVVLASIGDAVIACDKNSRIVLFNGVAEALTGFSAQEVIGRHYKKLIRFIREVDGKPSNDFIAEAIKSGKKTKMANHTLLIRKDHRKIPVADSAAPIRDVDGELIGCVVVFRDVAYEREVDRAKTEFVSLAAHQLRTPLGSMRWNLELLQENEKNLSRLGKERLHDATISNIRVISLISDLSNIVRIEQGGIKPEFSSFKINEKIQAAIREVKQEIEIKSLRLGVSLPPVLPEVHCDADQFREVMQNLLSNAVKYNKKSGKIDIQVQVKDEFVEVRVSDNGLGIPLADHNKVFSKFYRSTAAQKVDTDGNGLGLFIVKSFVESWGGNIGFKSQKGKGTTFFFTMPIIKNKVS